MARYRMVDGTIIDTKRASKSWEEASDHDGNNYVSRATGSQWYHQQPYRSRKGRYYTEHTSNYQGDMGHVEWVSREEAARWLLHNDEELPEDLEGLEDELIE